MVGRRSQTRNLPRYSRRSNQQRVVLQSHPHVAATEPQYLRIHPTHELDRKRDALSAIMPASCPRRRRWACCLLVVAEPGLRLRPPAGRRPRCRPCGAKPGLPHPARSGPVYHTLARSGPAAEGQKQERPDGSSGACTAVDAQSDTPCRRSRSSCGGCCLGLQSYGTVLGTTGRAGAVANLPINRCIFDAYQAVSLMA